MPNHPVDERVLVIAAKQCRLFSRRQALEAGAYQSLIGRRVESGRWGVPLDGVYEIPGEPSSFERMIWLALLSSPLGAVVSHWTAAYLHRLLGFPPTRMILTIPHGKHHDSSIAVLYQSSAPPKPMYIRSIPVTSIERTFIDLASVTTSRRIGDALEQAVVDNRTTLELVRREFLRLARQGRPGIVLMRQLLDDQDSGPVPRRSELERRLHEILSTIPVKFTHEAPFPGREQFKERVDRLADEPRKLIIEGDSRRWHARERAMTRDRQRDRRALAAGYPTVRYSYWELVNDKAAVRAEICELLGLADGEGRVS